MESHISQHSTSLVHRVEGHAARPHWAFLCEGGAEGRVGLDKGRLGPAQAQVFHVHGQEDVAVFRDIAGDAGGLGF